jgi:uncharacterized membrane-anchored protein YhcB (DUF1043 family)
MLKAMAAYEARFKSEHRLLDDKLRVAVEMEKATGELHSYVQEVVEHYKELMIERQRGKVQ